MEKMKDILTIKQLIHQVIPYKKEIIFFGSRARENHKEDSDYDILVIVYDRDPDRKKLAEFQSKIKHLCARLGMDVDVIVRDRAHADQMKNFPGNIINSAIQTGIHIQ